MSYSYQVRQLSKAYSDFTLGPLDLNLQRGCVQGLVGPNGSGKTTLLLCLMGMASCQGKIEIGGQEVNLREATWKRQVGFVSDEPAFYEGWSGARNLRFISQFYPSWSSERAEELARRFDLPLNKKAWTYSRGNRTKLALVAAMAHRPSLYLFDEPTAGLDPLVRHEVMETLWEDLRDGERSILYSTHVVTDLQRFADELVFLSCGKVTVRTDKVSLEDRWRRLSFPARVDVTDLAGAVEIKRQNGQILVVSSDAEATLKDLRNRGLEQVEQTRLSMEEIAVSIIKEGCGCGG